MIDYGPRPTDADTAIEYDDCVIGSGAAGAVVANALASAGRRVLILERGPFVRRDAREEEDGMAAADKAYVPTSSGLALGGSPWTTCNVGGGTVFYAGVSFRPRRVDFVGSRHFPDADLPAEWPFGYDDLDRHFDEIEAIQGVTGGEGDPLYPGAKHAPRLPAFDRNPEGQRLFAAADRLGIRGFATPLAVLKQGWRGRDACNRCGPCDEYRCPTMAKGDALTVFLRPILDRATVSLFAGIVACRLVRSRERRVDTVEVVDVTNGRKMRFRAKTFFIAANAIQSAALLLRSADEWEPTGIGNKYDLVGRGLCMKATRYCLGHGVDMPFVPHAGPFSTFATTDFYLHADAPNGMGGLLYENHLEHLAGQGRVLIEALVADTPRRRNRVHLAHDTGAFGIPRLVIDYQTASSDAARLSWLADRGVELLRAAGASRVELLDTAYERGSAHLHGTCRAGSDERTSVVDPWGRIHGVDNTYVVDGGFLPTPTGVNPTPTIQACAHRIVSGALEVASAPFVS